MIRLVLLLAACNPEEPTTPPPPTDSAPTTPPETTPTVRDPKFDGAAAALLAELGPNLAEGASIAVLEQGELTWVEGFGTAKPGKDVPVTPDMTWQIGSTTKHMTALAALMAVERGTLTLDDPVSQMVPGFSLESDPSWGDAATLHLLLSHQGGFVDALDWRGPADDAELEEWHRGYVAETLWPMNPPGAFWNYANPNFTFAGLGTELADGARMYPDLLLQDVFAPLGMSASFLRRSEVEAYGSYPLSTGILLDPYGELDDVRMNGVADPASARPAGLAWSTPTDMTKWGSFLIHGDPAIVDDELRAELWAPHVNTLYYDDHMQYGYGLFVWDLYPLSDGWYPLRVWEHGGNTLSFTSLFFVLPDQDVVISLLSNGYGDLWYETTEAILREVVDPFPAVSDYPGPAIDLTQNARHAGEYLDAYNIGPVSITEGGTYGLQLAAPLLDQYGYDYDASLIPGSTDVWYLDLGAAGLLELTFIADPLGGGDLYLRNRAFVAQRQPDVARFATPSPSIEQVAAAIASATAPSPIRLPPPRFR